MKAFIQAAPARLEHHFQRRRPNPRTALASSPRAQLAGKPPADWRAFRARLVQTESTTPTAPVTETTEWAHEVPFVEAGSLLIASPEHFVGEHVCSFFANSVVLILSHSRTDGTVGVILNRPIASSVSDLKLRNSQTVPLYLGGPVGLDGLLVVHRDASVPGSVEVVRGVATSGLREVVRRVEEGVVPADECRFFCGYSGWSPGQLQEEIDGGVWYTCASSTELIMRQCANADDTLVRKLLALMGGRYTDIGERLDDKDTERNFEI